MCVIFLIRCDMPSLTRSLIIHLHSMCVISLIQCDTRSLTLSLIVLPHRMCVIPLIRCDAFVDPFFDLQQDVCDPTNPM